MAMGDVDVSKGREPVPAGRYEIEVRTAEVATSRNSGNDMIKLVLSISSGPYMDKWIYDQMMLTGTLDSITAGKRRMKELLTSIGHPNPDYLDDTDELVGGKCWAQVAIDEQPGYAPKNVVKYYASAPASQVSMGAMAKKPAAAQQAPPQHVPPQAPPGAYKRPQAAAQAPPQQAPPTRTPPPSRQSPPPETPETPQSLAEENVPF
jgi:hypothetical protein